MKNKGMFKALLEYAAEELQKANYLRDVEISLTCTQNQKAYYRRQLLEYRAFNRSMYELGRLTDNEFTEQLQLEYIVEKAIDNAAKEGV